MAELVVLLEIRDRIGQDEPPFGVSVGDLHSFAAVAFIDIAGFVAGRTDRIFSEGKNADQIDFELELGGSLNDSQGHCGACHVALHRLDADTDFEIEPACIERDPFADDRGLLFGVRIAAVFEDNEGGIAGCGLPNGQNQPHFFFFQGLFIEDRRFDLGVFFFKFFGKLLEGVDIDIVGIAIDEIADKIHR